MSDHRPEKCTRQLPPVRISETLEVALHRLAAVNERSLSEYIKLVLSRHAFGHAAMLEHCNQEGQRDGA